MNQDIQQQITGLHERLARLERADIDAQAREGLLLLLGDLTRLLGSSLDDEDQPLTERLEGLAVRFEAEHPAVGHAVRQLIDALAKAGI